jgi:glycosyltransferase involved in cell wall biosynthesis
MKLSVVIPVYNERRYVGELLARVQAVALDVNVKEVVH